MTSVAAAKPIATTTIEPIGRRTAVPRDHSIKVVIKLTTIEAKYADKAHVASVARKSLEAFPPASGERDWRTVDEITVSSRGRDGSVGSVVVGVESSVVWAGRPGDDSVERLRAELRGEGYRVAVREKRECVEPDCAVEVMVDWNRLATVPSGWFSSVICGSHNYRDCVHCGSIYVLTSTNSAGQAPSVSCEVCGAVMVEWGGSKIWNAELITRVGAHS